MPQPFLLRAGGLTLEAVTGLTRREAIAATTIAIEWVVLRHMHAQLRDW